MKKTNQKTTCLVGLQYGDEGKGSISQYLGEDYDVFVRFNGGGNAGHTIYKDGRKIVTHFLPVGITNNKNGFFPTVILGNGMVINPDKLVDEIEEVAAVLGCEPEYLAESVFISDKAHVITEKHLEKDREREKTQNIGTTKTGVGPAYESKYNRTGQTIGEFIHTPEAARFNDILWDQIVRSEELINNLYEQGRNIFFEGAQGFYLDVDFGQYPFVTSSSCLPSAVGPGAGFSPRLVQKNIGVIKPYSTRVGSGPFPTKMDEKDDEKFRALGGEFGATTGRPRMCGWLDLPALKHAIRIGDIDEIALSKLDIIQQFDEIPVCVTYILSSRFSTDEIDGTQGYISHSEFDNIEPVYENWRTDEFVELLQRELYVPVSIVSTGPNVEDKKELA